jgi:hypothetical protein
MSVRARAEKRRLPDPPLRVESVTDAGLVVGWAQGCKPATPATVRLWHGSVLVAEARALLFRPDLLRAGLSHGHHGFAARLRTALPPGPAALAAQLDDHPPIPVCLDVPPQVPAPPQTVEQLLAPPATWTAADLLAHPACLPWSGFQSAMGPDRFIDAAFRFVLHRWPSKAEAQVHARALARGAMTAEMLILRLLRSHERADLPSCLMSPFDPECLFSGAAGGIIANPEIPAPDSLVIAG